MHPPTHPPVQLYAVPPELIPDLWARIAQTFGWTTSDPPPMPAPVLRNQILTGHWHVFVAPHWRFPTRFASVIVTTIDARPRRKKRILKVYFLAGRYFRTWMESAACTLSAFAQATGCTHCMLIGRQGFMPLRHLIDGYPARRIKWFKTKRGATDADRNHDNLRHDLHAKYSE